MGDKRNSDPKALIQSSEKKVVEKITKLINQIKPQVIITHDQSGGYGHPDHIFISQTTTQAIKSLKDKSIKLYHQVIPRWWFISRSIIELLQGKNPKKHGRNQDMDITKLGVSNQNIDVALDIRDYWEKKKDICAQHMSQGGVEESSYFNTIPTEFLQKLIIGKEYYQQIYPKLGKIKKQDLFT